MSDAKCQYNGKIITVQEYFKKPGVRGFEKKLVKKAPECSLYRDGICRMSDEPCKVQTKGVFPTHPKRRCLVFENMVLPADEKLHADYMSVFQGDGLERTEKRSCDKCRKPIEADSPNRKYCSGCKRLAERDSKRGRMRRYREGKEDY